MDIGFILKQFITFFVEPLGMVLTLLALGIYFLYKNKKFNAKLFLTLGFALLLLYSYVPFSNYLVSNLETRYPKYDYKEKVKYIHVLGCGHNDDPEQSLSSQLAECSIKRTVEGVLIHKKNPNSILIFTGYAGKTNISTAQMHANLALALGVKQEDMIINPKPKDTEEEAFFAQTIIGTQDFILVTSATHMPRAMTLFKSLKMNPIPAPTHFLKKDVKGYLYAPSISSFKNSKIAIHEYLGILWNKIKS